MKAIRKIWFAYAGTLVVLATSHLLIIIWNAIKTGDRRGVTMLDILDIAYVADPGTYGLYVEIFLWIVAAVLFAYFWKRAR